MAPDAESVLGSAPPSVPPNLPRGLRFLELFNNLEFGLIPKNFKILGAEIRKYYTVHTNVKI